MKTRSSFVANSSSSSFIIISLGEKIILEDGDTYLETCGGTSMDIDVLMKELQLAKENGLTQIHFTHGGGYEG